MARARTLFQRLALVAIGGLIIAFAVATISRAEHAHDRAHIETHHAEERSVTHTVTRSGIETVFLDESFSVREGDRLTLRVGADDVTVETANGTSARVIVEGTGRDAREVFERRRYRVGYQGGELVVRTDEDDRGSWRRGQRADLRVTVQIPERFDASVQVGSGDIEFGSLTGDLELSTGSGDVRVGDVQGAAIRIETGSGSIDADALDADVVVMRTGSGDVTAQRIAGATTVETGSGDVEIGLQEGDVTVETGSGEVEIDFDRAYRTDVRTGSGEVSLGLPGDASADIEFDGGDVSIDRDFGFQGRSDDDSARGTIGGGGPRIHVGTGSGEIDLNVR